MIQQNIFFPFSQRKFFERKGLSFLRFSSFFSVDKSFLSSNQFYLWILTSLSEATTFFAKKVKLHIAGISSFLKNKCISLSLDIGESFIEKTPVEDGWHSIYEFSWNVEKAKWAKNCKLFLSKSSCRFIYCNLNINFLRPHHLYRTQTNSICFIKYISSTCPDELNLFDRCGDWFVGK